MSGDILLLAMTSRPELLFPTGNKPGWELDEPQAEGEQPLQGIADRCVIA